MSYKKFTALSAINHFTTQLIWPFLIIFFIALQGGTFITAGIAMGLFKGSQLLMKIPFNWIGDKTSRKPLMVLGALGGAFVFYRLAGTTQIEEAYFLMVLIGFFAGMTSVGAAFLAEMTRGEERGAKVGFFSTFVGLSVAVAVYIGGSTIEMFGFSTMFYVVAVSDVFYAFMLLFVKLENQ